MILDGAAPDAAYLDGLAAVFADDTLDPAYRALMLGLPSQSDLASLLHEAGHVPDPQLIWNASETMKQAQAERLADVLPTIYANNQVTEPYRPDAEQSGERSLANAALSLLGRFDGGTQAKAQYDAADNMTQQLAALGILLREGVGKSALQAFERQWKDDRLVMDKWFALQVMQAAPDAAVDIAKALTEHTDFNWKNPNRFRAVLGALAMHHAGFHHASGGGYAFLADWLIRLDPVNPQTTARMCSAFQTWRRYDSARQSKIESALDRILETPDLSRDTTEMITRIRGA